MSAAPQIRTALLENLKELHLPAGNSNCRPSRWYTPGAKSERMAV
jgi:hypothetical protein